MNNKVKFLRGTSNEYAVAEKDSDTIYFTTDDGKLYIGNKEILGESIKALNSHINDSVKHITSTERTNWNAAKTHADSAHAPSNAQANVIETVKVNGTALTPSSKAVDITVPSVGNGTITIKQAGTTKGTFTTNQSGNTTIELTDNNTDTWRGIQNNLTSDSTTDSLSAAQGKVLKGLVDEKAAASHSHNYAGSSSAGGAATTALACTGNSATATKLATARTIALTGSVTGSGTFDGSGNLSIATTTNHTHTKSATVTLTSSGWSSNSQTVSSSIVTASNIVLVAPIPSNQDAYCSSSIKCTTQSSGSLVFTCDSTPDVDINVNVVTL